MLKDEDIQVLTTLLHPATLVPLAQKAGLKKIAGSANLDYTELIAAHPTYPAVLGAYEAYKFARDTARQYIRFVRQRDSISVRDLDVAQTLRHLGLLPDVQAVGVSFSTFAPWRRSAAAIWDQKAGTIPGRVSIPVNSRSLVSVEAAVIKAVSRFFLANPNMNMSFLRGVHWQRYTEEILVTTRYQKRDGISSIRLNAAHLSCRTIAHKISRATVRAARAAKNSAKLLNAGADLTQAWVNAGGFIASPASAMVSFVGPLGVPEGDAALCTDLNGIPVAITIGQIIDDHVTVSANIDHRVWDAYESGSLYEHLLITVPILLKEEM